MKIISKGRAKDLLFQWTPSLRFRRHQCYPAWHEQLRADHGQQVDGMHHQQGGLVLLRQNVPGLGGPQSGEDHLAACLQAKADSKRKYRSQVVIFKLEKLLKLNDQTNNYHLRVEALVLWLWELTHCREDMGSNPGAIYWMDMIFFS